MAKNPTTAKSSPAVKNLILASASLLGAALIIGISLYLYTGPLKPKSQPTRANDPALAGTWRLKTEAVIGIVNPVSGRTLIINSDGTYSEDWSTTQVNGGTNCTASGKSFGKLSTESVTKLTDFVIQGVPNQGTTLKSAEGELDATTKTSIDALLEQASEAQKSTFYARFKNNEGAVPDDVVFLEGKSANLLRVTLDQSNAKNVAPSVKCEKTSVDISKVGATSRLASPQSIMLDQGNNVLTAGSTTPPDKIFVPYIYGFNADKSVLVIRRVNGASLDWIFEKQ